MNALGMVIFVVGLLTCVVIHEAGHFLTARAFGMKATQFFVGFGQTLWSFQRGETEYGIKAIPAGGFVKIIGMVPEEEVAPEDEARAFWRAPAGQRTIVLAAGSTMHFVIAAMLLLGVAFFRPIETPSPVVKAVSTCVTVSGAEPTTEPATGCAANQVAAPAVGKLLAGDRLVSIDGHKVTTFDQAADLIRRSVATVVEAGVPDKEVATPLSLVVLRKGVETPVSITAVPSKTTGDTGVVGRIGITPQISYPAPTWHQGLHAASTFFGTSKDGIVRSTLSGIAGIPGKFGTIFDKNRSADGPSSVVGITRISGEALADRGEPFSYRLWFVIGILGSVNLFVGILNLLPLLPFDGGHIALIIADKVRAGFARVRRRPAPPRISYSTVAPVSYAVFLVIILGSFAVLGADIFNPAHLPG